ATAYHEAVKLNPKLAESDLDGVLGGPEFDPDADDEDEEPLPWDDDDDVDAFGRMRQRQTSGDRPEELALKIEKPDINFDHVGGMDDLKDEIRIKIIEPLNHPEIYAAYGKMIGGGIL